MTHEEEMRDFLGDLTPDTPEPEGCTTEELAQRFTAFFEPMNDFDGGASGCNTCGGAGFIVVCIDDMCRGAGECMHGDGEIPCPDCDGDL